MPDAADDRPNVVLTGFMGTGKSTIARGLAARIGYRAVDTDHIVVERHGPIPGIFRTAGEARFREIEAALAAELAAERGLVIATGGRMLVDPASRAALGATGRIFCLSAPVATIVRRVMADGIADRPMLAGADDLEQRITALLAERRLAYDGFEQVDADRDVDAIVTDIAARLER